MAPKAPVPHLTHRRHLPSARTRAGRWLEKLGGALLLPLVILGALAGAFASQAYMPGVVVETTSRPGPTDGNTATGGEFFVPGLTERGSTTEAIPLRSMSDYADKLGDRVAYGFLFDTLTTYFAEGGTLAYVARVVGPTASVGNLTLLDTDDEPTVRIDSLDVGPHSSRIKVQVTAGSVADTYKLIVLYDDVPVDGETYNNLATPADAVAALAGSRYARAVDLDSVTAAPDNNPKVIAATALTAGTDDRVSVTAPNYVTALARFGPELGDGTVAIPGQPSSTVGAGLIAHARTHNRIALLAASSGSTTGQAKTAALALRGSAGSEHAGLFYPWVTIPDGSGGDRAISPEGYVAGVRARTLQLAGPWRAPAGAIAIARFVSGVATKLTDAEIEDLNSEQVCAIRTISGGVRLYGWRSLSADERSYRLLTGRDVLNRIAVEGKRRLERLVFENVDAKGHLRFTAENEMLDVVTPMAAAGGLYPYTDPGSGEERDPGYEVDAGPTVNTAETLANDEFIVDVGVRPSPTAELIRLRITKVTIDTPL